MLTNTVQQLGSAYWLGDSNNESVQRVAGISFPNKQQLDEYHHFLAEAAKRNHRKIGAEQKLFFFDPVSPGSCFFLPHGTRIYNSLLDLIREEYRRRGYDEVITPNMYKADLWKTSGHWDHYADGKPHTITLPRFTSGLVTAQPGMFTFEVEKEQFGLKPMNCPGHCKIFAHSDVSYRELPWRMADFGVVHRNEFSGALTGLTRVRRFVQDDAHIFCTPEQVGPEANHYGVWHNPLITVPLQISEEIDATLSFLQHIYGICGFTFRLKLSTRPDKYIGDPSIWDAAEAQLRASLDKFGSAWEENPGDGAFYGPKIDVELTDALRREHQCGTIQLDFNLPRRFQLRYATKKEGPSNPEQPAPSENEKDGLPAGYARPVMIHRAVLGSFERMFGVLTEHFAGRWPFWLSPRQVLVVPVMPALDEYAEEVRALFKEKAGLYVDADLSGNTLRKKVRRGQVEGYNFVFGKLRPLGVVGVG